MRRPRVGLLALLFLLLVLPIAGAQSDRYAPDLESPATIDAGAWLYWTLDSAESTRYDVMYDASAPLDLLLIPKSHLPAFTAGGEDWQYWPDQSLIGERAGRRLVELPSEGEWVLILDNTRALSAGGGGTGDRPVTVTAGLLTLHQPGTTATFADALRTLFLRQDFFEFPLIIGIGLAGPSLIFLFLAFAAEGVANDEQSWLSFAVMTVLAVAVTVFVPSEGVIIQDTRLLTIPAALLGYWTYRRTADTTRAACGVFAACYLGGLVGADILNLWMNYDVVREDYLYAGSIAVIGGAGWADGLIVVPVVGVLTFWFFRGFSKRTLLVVETSLQGDTAGGTLFVKVINVGEEPARNIRLQVGFGGHGIPSVDLTDGLLVESLEPGGYYVTHAVERPHERLPPEIRRPDYIYVGVKADNAPPVADRLDLKYAAV